MSRASNHSDDALTDDRRRMIREICRDHDFPVGSLHLRDNILILTPASDAALGDTSDLDVDRARRLAGDLKDLGFDFVTVSPNDSISTEQTSP